ncbi:hypothetical protein SEA_BIG4_126 [Microbacterium phage Big4]|nr:hypothetical protein SEA_BIG4_126 [Microbacterium phage Big4]
MDLRDDIPVRLNEMIARIPKSIEHPRDPEKITLIQAHREIMTLRAQIAHMNTFKATDEEHGDPQHVTRATRSFTPVEAADFIEEAMSQDLRHTPDQAEALQTLFAVAREREDALD